MAKQSSEISNTIKMDVASSEKQKKSLSLPFEPKDYPEKLTKIYQGAIAALKIITIASIGESTEFFGTYENYEKLSKFISTYSLGDGSIPSNEKNFAKAPIDKWIEYITIVFGILYAMPKHGFVKCNRLTNGKNKDDEKNVGGVMSIKLTLEAFDWKDHLLSLFIPEDTTSYRMMLLVDNSPILFTNSEDTKKPSD